MTHGTNHFALVIGIDHYPEWADGERTLQGAIRDASDFHKWLVDPQRGGLDPDNARLIISSDDPAAPLQERIDEEFAIIKANSEGRRQRFYFFFSGHGHSTAMSAGEQALRLANWSLDRPGAALHFDNYFQTSMGCLRFEEGLFFLDCCRSREGMPRGKPSDLACGDPSFGSSQHITYYATEPYKAAFEYDTHGIFGKALVDILNQGTIEALDLERRLKKTVTETALTAGKRQTARAVRDAVDDIFLGPPPSSSPPDPGPPDSKDAPSPPDPTLVITLDTNLSRKVSLEDAPAPAPGRITLYRDDEFVESMSGRFERAVPEGPYRIHIAHGDALAVHDIDVRGTTTLHFELPRRDSAAPLSSTIDKREIITDPIVAASRYRIKGARDASQALFIAHRRQGTPVDGAFDGSLNLLSPGEYPKYLTGNRLLIRTEPGTHVLSYDQPDAAPLMLAVPVVAGWDTHLFFVEEEGRPLLERASISMRPAGKGFDPADALIDAYERAVADLASDGPGPDRSTLDNLLHRKFKNPLFGLVGAHFLLRELARPEAQTPHRMDMLDTVIGNMGRLLGEQNADVVALRLLRGRLVDKTPTEAQCEYPPLLRASLRALVEATAEQPGLLGPAFDMVALGATAGSPWCCWSRQASDGGTLDGGRRLAYDGWVHEFSMPQGARAAAIERILTEDGFAVSGLDEGRIRILRALGQYDHEWDDSLAIRRMLDAPDWLVEDLRDEIARSDRNRKPVDLAQAVKRLNLPYALVEQTLRVARVSVVEHATPGLALFED